jgi:hypothetical protein
VWISEGLKEADYDHKIIKALEFSKPKPRSPSPKITPVIDYERERYMINLKQLSSHPFINELQELYDLGMTDLKSNLKAIDVARGNLENAYNYL